MKLHSFEFNGSAGIPNDRPARFYDLTNLNLIIGPNNSGKSSVIRMLFKSIVWAATGQTIQEQTPQGEFWLHRQSPGMLSYFKVTGVPAVTNDQPGVQECLNRLCADEQLHVHVTVTADKVEVDCTDAAGTTNGCNGNALQLAKSLCIQSLRRLRSEFIVFDAVRALDRKGPLPHEDGSALLGELWQMQTDGLRSLEWGEFNDTLTNRINSIFQPLGMPCVSQIAMKVGGKMQVHFDCRPSIPVPIEQMGSGIAQLFIILSLLIRKKGSRIVCIEEPETNLHPGLLRRFVDQLRDFAEVQFFITTHSHVLLDCLEASDRVFQMRQLADGSCNVEPCLGTHAQHHLLDALGVRASALLQSNCVIWVEGPSDRLYIRHWLKEAGPKFREGVDFTFCYYGGSLLAHFDMQTNDQMTTDLVSMLCMARFGIVVMDRDLGPHEDVDKLFPRKKRIIESANKDKTHRMHVLTTGRDIENDLPREILLKASATLLGIEYEKIRAASITGDKGFEQEIVESLNEDPERAKTLIRKLSEEKVELARRIVELCEKEQISLSPPVYVSQMVDLISRSEQIEAVQTNM